MLLAYLGALSKHIGGDAKYNVNGRIRARANNFGLDRTEDRNAAAHQSSPSGQSKTAVRFDG
ncbi:hypothetical protein SDC9_211886 [bioreactor metagenome]|uniref:Uncharacterized protein n=1 Tax=bioreactor metagenome TaxID=1076179 RepID=A0A645JKC4_9ZZZZ